MPKEEALREENPKAPTATTLWCCPCLADVCGSGSLKGVDEEETVVTGEEAQTEAAEEAKTEAAEAEEAEDAADKYQGDEGEGEVAAAADSEADQTNAAAAAGPRTAAAKPKPKPRRQVRPAGKKAPKSSPAFFTGKAAGLPPPPKEACVGPPPPVADPTFSVGLGAYLVYTDAEGGRLKNQWSKTPLTGSGILAYLCPEKEVADYKFEKKSAVEIYATDCEKSMASEFPADRIKYYEGWATFFKQLSAHGGTIVLLPAAVAEPPPKVKVVMFNKGKLSPVEVGQEVTINAFECLAVVPSNATKFNVKEMPHSDFMALANSQGVYVNLKK
ncbi:hypothetical protein, conserved [Eimeria tenella]|uniref:Immune mapped protein 2 N-terminal domain-containing protein n=1 Tax=Eimeria tenella TaxID=5802 RepID=U6KJQ3_EIMTE|nr:hypothetical protein, conserved [Eimeria tenella]CDJ37031.1 hypothetical protein, conserved [Eimeria tenella]|eukprot:XP_013227869.1 hypothetical protein, conserved [Eimeria tenella]